MSDVNVTIVGNVASDVRSQSTRDGRTLASFRLASQRRYYSRRKGRWVEEEAAFYRIVCWRGLAENVSECVQKGEPVIVQGRMRLKDWTDDDGQNHTDAEVDAWSVAYDLMRGTASFTRRRTQQGTSGDDDDPLDPIRSEQRARAGEDVIVDPQTGEMFSLNELHRERGRGSDHRNQSVGDSEGTSSHDAVADSSLVA